MTEGPAWEELANTNVRLFEPGEDDAEMVGGAQAFMGSVMERLTDGEYGSAAALAQKEGEAKMVSLLFGPGSGGFVVRVDCVLVHEP